MSEQSVAALETVILEKLALQLTDKGPVGANTSFASLGVDSIGVVILVAELESALDFVFDPADLDMTHFTHAGRLASLLHSKYQLTGE
ncbi:acyl carrier protein [Cronobacter turicensis]|uniref:acyl carrier protein n=1 Tax=Cronobacter TaxID=413496 RepID=UPI000CFE1D22|nr:MULTISPECIES: acyl carrier protein [Cronobacter]MEB8541095.1 acyl carrier protein [Cronobacter sakazakii]EGT4493995.1 acyl carrier protein [Cronobacter turicensis]EKM0364382.1 acyl carrier protein [Cronobacter turicensis]EKM0438959.1 acyl carrier protein [Cronobacter turicensis]EKM0527752.1 acyl carrier protein [Cronobacter turicensis]